jgi:PAS domain S-box-containing protein
MTFTGQYRFRLTIGLPLVVICFTLAAGFLPIGMLDYSLSRVDRPIDLRPLILDLRIAVLLISLVASVLAVLISRHIVRPVERIIAEMEGFSGPPEREGSTDKSTDDEIDKLSKLYNQTFVPMKGYLTTSDLFLQMSEGIVSMNADGKIVFLNAPMERLLGIERQDYTGRHYSDLFANSDRNAEIHKLIQEVLHGGMLRTRELLLSTLAGRNVYVRTTVSPATGRRHESLGVVMLFQDVEELSRLRDQLRRMDVLASIGSTITGMAHEVRTPLGYIRGLAELIKEDLPKDASQQKYVQMIIESIDRLNLMVEDILSLASVKVDTSETVDPSAIVRESITYVRQMITTKELSLLEDHPDTQRLVKGDRLKLVESFTNILRNACEAAPRGASLTVRIRPILLSTLAEFDHDTIMIEFQNEGSYISPENREKLFTPFFTTKKDGTGLGLAISKQIIEAHGGAIQVESEQEIGTVFRVMLPAIVDKHSSLAAESVAQ